MNIVNKLTIIMIAAIGATLAACHTTKQEATSSDSVVVAYDQPLSGQKPQYLPKAVLYKTNGNYADNVAINMNADRTQIISFPAPTDVDAASAGLPIANGWMLDRRGGVGLNTAFLKYTYAEYAALKQPLSVDEMMQAIIPDARVTEVKQTPVGLNQALNDPESLVKYAE